MKYEKKTKNRIKKDLCKELECLDVNTRGKTLKEVQEIALSKNIPIVEEHDDILEVWIGKPKGIKQVIFCHPFRVSRLFE
jgi:hypothetical protein